METIKTLSTDYSGIIQAILILLTVIVTIILYYAEKRKEVQNAATILLLQIKDIEININYIKQECITPTVLVEKPLHYSSIIFEENYWTKYNHLFADKLNNTSFEKIDSFFKVAEEIKRQQKYIKDALINSLNTKASHFYNANYQLVNLALDNRYGFSLTQRVVSAMENTENIINKDKTIITEINEIKDAVDSYYNIISTTYLPIEFGDGLRKTISMYIPLSDSVAFHKVEKLSKKNS